MSKAIVTKYLGATNYRGSRIKASDEDGNSVTVSYPSEQRMGADAHSVAALALCRKMGWTYGEQEWQHTHLIGGSLKNNYVFVFARLPEPRPENEYDVYKLPEAES